MISLENSPVNPKASAFSCALCESSLIARSFRSRLPPWYFYDASGEEQWALAAQNERTAVLATRELERIDIRTGKMHNKGN